MQQTIVQLPMQMEQTSSLVGPAMEVIYQQPPPLLPVHGGDVALVPDFQQEAVAVPGVPIGRRRIEILKALVDCQDLTIDQLQRWLRLSPASQPYLREHLRELATSDYVEAM